MAPRAVSAIFLLTLMSASGPAMSVGEAAPIHSATSERLNLRLFDLAAVRRLFHMLARPEPAMTEGERVDAVTDVSLMTEAVIGDSLMSPFTFDELARAATSVDEGPRVLATRGVAARDLVAYQLLSLGYSARETADVVSGRISRQALDTAQKMIAVGQGRDVVAKYLDAQYRRPIPLPDVQTTQPPEKRSVSFSPFDALIEQYAKVYRIEVAMVRAIIQTESAFNPLARSHAGAIGLMQLMPATARELGVNPFVPEQNIEGGVRYFSQLLQIFGGVELALVAYNAGPGFAQRYAQGHTALYGETRDYVKKVLARLRD